MRKYKEHMIKGEVLSDPREELLKAFEVRVTPFGFAMDAKGIVRAKGLCGGTKHLEHFISILKKGVDV